MDQVEVKRKIKQVVGWRKAFTLASVRTSLAGFGVMGLYEFGSGVWNSLPPEMRDRIPNAAAIGMLIFAINIGARIYKYVKEDQHGNELE